MKAYNAIMHAVYAIAIVGAIAFVAAGVVPNNMDNLEFDISTDCEYPVTDSEDNLKNNIRNAMGGTEETVTVYRKGGSSIAIISHSSLDTDIDHAVDAIKLLETTDEDARVVLKTPDNKTLTQDMIIKQDGLTMSLYTEIKIFNIMRYDLMDVYLGASLYNKGSDTDYKVLDIGPTTLKAGKSTVVPVSLEINLLKAAGVLMYEDEGDMALDAVLDVNVSGRYFFGMAGASVNARVDVGSLIELPELDFSFSVDPTEIKISMDDKLEDLPESVTVTIGDVTVEINNNDTDGFSVVIDTDGVRTIVDALTEQYENGDYTVVITMDGDTETVELEKEDFEMLIEIVNEIMEAFA